VFEIYIPLIFVEIVGGLQSGTFYDADSQHHEVGTTVSIRTSAESPRNFTQSEIVAVIITSYLQITRQADENDVRSTVTR
jgi:hypothetical protein